ncbi:MAG: DUF402 domain-containing protein [Lachnospiraceae bacterium]|nr:DUF402 domain-containing protein [Lachnospiraceae bacterium]
MQDLKLFRKRIIPDECIFLKDDIILFCDENMIVTKWNVIKPKKDLHHGYSCYFLKEGFKVSKFYKADNSLLYWYCDIVDYDYKENENTLTATDLLADVAILPDGSVRVVDLDELAEVLDNGALPVPMVSLALERLNRLLVIIYSGKFNQLKIHIEEREA